MQDYGKGTRAGQEAEKVQRKPDLYSGLPRLEGKGGVSGPLKCGGRGSGRPCP